MKYTLIVITPRFTLTRSVCNLLESHLGIKEIKFKTFSYSTGQSAGKKKKTFKKQKCKFECTILTISLPQVIK